MFYSGLDLNCAADICHPARNSFAGGIDGHGQAGVRADHGASATDDVSSLRSALRGRTQSQNVFLPRSVSLHGVRAAYLSRKPARHRSLPGSTSGQALSHGHPQQRSPQHLGQCERGARLARLCRLGPVAHWNRPSSLCRGAVWRRSERYGLRARCQHHRPVPVGVSVGPVSLDQGGHQAAHALGPTRQHPHVSAHQRWQASRRQCPGPVGARAGRLLRHGPRLQLHRLRTAASLARGLQLLCDARQIESQRTAPLFASRRPQHGVDLRSDRRAHRLLLAPRLRHAVRRIRFRDPETDKRLVFLTNNFTLPAITITALYRCRWQVELFFKWIKQHLRIKVFFGTSENAVKSQIWIAVSVYVLVAIVKKRLNLSASLYEMLQILSLTMFERMPLNQLLTKMNADRGIEVSANQLNLFD